MTDEKLRGPPDIASIKHELNQALPALWEVLKELRTQDFDSDEVAELLALIYDKLQAVADSL